MRHRTSPTSKAGLTALGFKLADIKVLLGSHSHGDHVGGMAFFRRAAPNAKLPEITFGNRKLGWIDQPKK